MSSGSDEAVGSYGADLDTHRGPIADVWNWVAVEGDRLIVAALISLGTALLFLGLNAAGVIAFVNDGAVTRLAGGMIAGTFSLVTLVVSINQLILSQEFAVAGKSAERLEGVLSFREDAAASAGVPAVPASPARLLELLVASIHDRSERLAEASSTLDDGSREIIDRYADRVRKSTARVDETLEDAPGTFTTISASFDYDSSWQLYGARHLRGRYGDDLSADGAEALDELIDALELFSVAREHFKTTYLQRELTRFSQLTVYCGVPAILAAMLLGFLYGDIGGPAINAASLPYAVSALLAVVVSPLALLASYILRTAAITRRTAAVGPMVPQKAPSEGPFDVTYGEEFESDAVSETG